MSNHENIPVNNNRIYTKRIGSNTKDGRDTILLGVERVDTGIEIDEKEIAKDLVSGLNYERNKIVSKTIYDLSKQLRRHYFILDLETGQRGWYPGSILVADIKDYGVEIKKEMSDDSETVLIISNKTVKVIDLDTDTDKNIWYKIEYSNVVGYVRNTFISNVRYVDPY